VKNTLTCFAIAIASFNAAANTAPIVGDGLLWVSDFGRGIYTLDPATGQSIKRLDVTVGSTVINDLAFDSASGLLYGISGGALFGSPNTLFTINLTLPSLPVSLFGVVSTPSIGANSISGLAFVNGRLIASEWTGTGLSDKLFEINLTSLAYSNVVNVASPANFNVADLASFGQGLASVQGSPVNIFNVNSASGAVAVITTLSTPVVNNALAYASDRGMFYTGDSNRNVWETNATTLTTRLVGAVSIPAGGIAGMEYVSTAAPVPEPSQTMLLLAGIAVLATYLRRAHRRGEA
jgi:PEP-CTERM motif